MIPSYNYPVLKVLFLCFLCLFVAIPSKAKPRLHCDAPKYDFGTLIGQEKITHEFMLFNEGDEPLEIVKIKNCCGVASKVVPKMIPPGSSAVCTAVFTTRNRYGSQDKQILLITNDKKHPYFDLRLNGTLLKPIEFSPRWIRLGDLPPGSIVSQTITATNLLEQSITLETVSTTVSGLEAEIVESNLRTWTVQVSSPSVLAVGTINGQVQLHFSTGSVHVPVIGSVKPVLQATPERIQLSAGSSKDVERVIMLRSGDGRAFEVLSAKMENAEGKVAFKKLAEGAWRIKLTVQPDTIQPGASIIIKTSIESQDTNLIPLFR